MTARSCGPGSISASPRRTPPRCPAGPPALPSIPDVPSQESREVLVPVTDERVSNNEAYSAAFDKGDLPMPPAKKVAVVACMDARVNPFGALGLHEGDAHVIRNAGGVISDDAIRSLAISQRLLGTEE